MRGIVFDIKRFAIHDGNGLRTTIFMKGCPLDCWWCHNPESKDPHIQKYKSIDKIEGNQYEVLREIGRWMSTEEVMAEIEKERVFMEEGKGGVTLSGGEPLYQAKFSREILELCKSFGIHTALDTSGFAKEEDFLSVVPFTDLFLFDLKMAGSNGHKTHTGVDNKLIIINLKHAVGSEKDVIARIPVVPGVNLNQTELEGIANIIRPLKSDNFSEVHLLPYHKLGKSKNAKFGYSNGMKEVNEPKRQEIENYIELFKKEGFKVKIH
ncbi:MAG: glycyl-radical enzyme activating protein [Bacteroidales bacterium]|nr:glycyl-radical enzyme activating protein [Bacteroidales bacterium]